MLSNRGRPLETVMNDETVSPRVRGLLAEIGPIKEFGKSRGLKPTKNYAEYVQLKHPYVVTSVAACRPLAFESKSWSFPIVGSFPYLGFFDPADANEYATELHGEGWDVYVRGATAYSTLGWFRDPVLSSMIPEGDEALGELVDVVLHESMHATLYIENQTFFNESVATFVGERMAPEYLRARLGPDSAAEKAYLSERRRDEEIVQAFHGAYGELDRLYRSPASDADKLAAKAKVFAGLKEKFGLKRELNNAALVEFKAYHDGKPLFEALFRKCGTDWSRFLTALSRLKRESFSLPQQEDLAPALNQVRCD